MQVMGSFYRSQHELCFVFKHGRAPHLNTFELGQHGRQPLNLWTYAGVNTFKTGRMDELWRIRRSSPFPCWPRPSKM